MTFKKHPVRLERIFDAAPSYFLTFCAEGRKPVLDRPAVSERMRQFVEGSLERYGVFVSCWLLMSDHCHLIATFSPSTETTLGNWVKALKRFVGDREFTWQRGFFDHVLRSDESRSEKWNYISMNPVRAGLVERTEEWPFKGIYDPRTGEQV